MDAAPVQPTTHRRRPNACPQCGRNDEVVPILYGMPASETLEAAERGELQIGGCVIDDDQPTRFCKRCQHAF